MTVKQARHTVEGLSLHPQITASRVLVTLCIVGHCHDNTNNNQMSHRVTSCSEEVKSLFIVVWPNELFSQSLDTVHKNSKTL